MKVLLLLLSIILIISNYLFLFTVSLTQKDLINAYASVSSLKRGLSPNTLAKEATEILANGSYSEFISNSTAYLTARGLTPNTFSFNGIVISNSLGQFLMSTLGREQFLLMQYFTDRIIRYD